MPAPYGDDKEDFDEEPPDTARIRLNTNVKEKGYACGKMTCMIAIGVPAVVTVFSIIFGGILAAIEETSFENGFWLAATILSTSSTPLGDNVTLPDTDGGKFFSVICGTWAMGIFGILVVLMSAPAMDPVYGLLRLR